MKKKFLRNIIGIYFIWSRFLHFQKWIFRLYNNLAYDLFCAFWMGIFDKEALDSISLLYYDKSKLFFNEAYNNQGLFEWEKDLIGKYFRDCKSLLVTAAGGGREVIALRHLGHDTDGLERNTNLVKRANELLKKKGFLPNIKSVDDENPTPSPHKKYSGVIVGWGSYMYIPGKKHRVRFLKQVRTCTENGCPILLSFCYLQKRMLYRFKRITKIGSTIRTACGKERIELGDFLSSENYSYLLPDFVHHFSKEQIADELHEAGLKLIYFGLISVSQAAAVATSQS